MLVAATSASGGTSGRTAAAGPACPTLAGCARSLGKSWAGIRNGPLALEPMAKRQARRIAPCGGAARRCVARGLERRLRRGRQGQSRACRGRDRCYRSDASFKAAFAPHGACRGESARAGRVSHSAREVVGGLRGRGLHGCGSSCPLSVSVPGSMDAESIHPDPTRFVPAGGDADAVVVAIDAGLGRGGQPPSTADSFGADARGDAPRGVSPLQLKDRAVRAQVDHVDRFGSHEQTGGAWCRIDASRIMSSSSRRHALEPKRTLGHVRLHGEHLHDGIGAESAHERVGEHADRRLRVGSISIARRI